MPYLSATEESAIPYEQMAQRTHRPVATLRSDVARLRKRYRAILREVVRDTVFQTEDVDEELRYLCRVWPRGSLTNATRPAGDFDLLELWRRLEETPGGGLGCMSCLLRAGIGSEEEVAQDSTPNAFEDGGRFGVYEIDCHPDGSLTSLAWSDGRHVSCHRHVAPAQSRLKDYQNRYR
jgi:hypothetical protein